MSLFHRLASVVSWIVRRDRAEQRLDDDVRSFVEMSIEEKVRDGAPPAEARRLALLELGGVEQVKERVRTGRHGALLDDIGRDVRYALRLFATQRTFAVVIIGTLALGIGANTAFFSIVDSLLLRTLPVEQPERLALLTAAAPSGQRSWTYPIWQEIQRHADRFDGVLAWTRFDAQFNLTKGGETQYANGVWASAGSFDVLGIKPALGRLFVPADDRPGGGEDGPVLVISHVFWQRHFAGARDVIGRTLTLERVPLTIVGVTPPGFSGLNVGRSFDVAVPFGAEPLIRGASESRLNRRTSWWLSVMVRLKPEQSFESATAALRTLQPGIREATVPPPRPGDTANDYLADPFTLIGAAAGQSGLREEYGRPLLVLMVVVGLVLLIACANIANLLLARAAGRSHEWSVRLALGASRGRLARQLLIESLLLAAMGGTGALLVARWGSDFLVSQLGADAVYLDLPLDWRMLAFTGAVALVAALVFGVAPALRAGRGAALDAMKERGRSNAPGRATVANGLVVIQVVMSVVLIVCAGLFLRSFGRLTRVPLGFDGDRILLASVDARRADVPAGARFATYERIRQRVLAVPGVEKAAVSIVAPLSGAMWSRRIEVSGSALRGSKPDDGPEGFGFTDSPIPVSSPLAVFNGVTPGWIATFGTPLLAGRDISESDGPGSPRVALVNQAFARKFLDGANPVGHTIRLPREPESPAIEIVGLLTDAVYRDVREATLPTAYVPLSQVSDDPQPDAPSLVTLSVRAAAARPVLLTKSVAAAVTEINPTLALTFQPLESQIGDTLMRERMLAILSASFGVLALLMAAVGLYGVTSYAVNLRRAEIGIRMALGATRGSVIRLVLGRVSLLVGAGIGLGLAVGAWASRFVATLLYGLEPGDPATLLASAATLALIGALAGWLPANRASHLDPTQVLREI